MNTVTSNPINAGKTGRKWFHNPNFWILAGIYVIITFLYYSVIIWDLHPDWSKQLKLVEYVLGFHGILYCIPIIYAAIAYRWRGVLAMWLVSVIAAMPIAYYYKPSYIVFFSTLLFLSIPLFIVGIVSLEVNWRHKEQKALLEREEERQSYLLQIFHAHEDERKRIAQELHDDTIHSLLLTSKKIHNLATKSKKMDDENVEKEINLLGDEIVSISNDVKRLTVDLRPGILDHLGFIQSIRWLVNRLNQEGAINVIFNVNDSEYNVPQKTDVILFRIVQEALNNIRLHSSATEAAVTLEFKKNKLNISISDNGSGFILPERMIMLTAEHKLGLIGIWERVNAIKGKLNINSKPGHGTLIKIECPL